MKTSRRSPPTEAGPRRADPTCAAPDVGTADALRQTLRLAKIIATSASSANGVAALLARIAPRRHRKGPCRQRGARVFGASQPKFTAAILERPVIESTLAPQELTCADGIDSTESRPAADKVQRKAAETSSSEKLWPARSALPDGPLRATSGIGAR